MNCNPFTLSELYLDGCDQLSDDAFDCLVAAEAEDEPVSEPPNDVDRVMESLMANETMIVNVPESSGGDDAINFSNRGTVQVQIRNLDQTQLDAIRQMCVNMNTT